MSIDLWRVFLISKGLNLIKNYKNIVLWRSQIYFVVRPEPYFFIRYNINIIYKKVRTRAQRGKDLL